MVVDNHFQGSQDETISGEVPENVCSELQST